MNRIAIPLMLALALAAAGCERKAPDNTSPRTSAQSSGTTSPSSAPQPQPVDRGQTNQGAGTSK